ncbi:hypothetical protein Lal_00027181 [Lupinus albus]|nr:hypothetical protein Lal_00027181 [Lupinus albus]
MYSSRSRLEVGRTKLRFRFSSRKVIRNIILCLVLFAILPPIFFHFRLSRFHQMQVRKCGWLNDPPLVCAHGGDSSKASPNTMAAYLSALHSQVDCIEIDVSRSLDGVLFALHDRNFWQHVLCEVIRTCDCSNVSSYTSIMDSGGIFWPIDIIYFKKYAIWPCLTFTRKWRHGHGSAMAEKAGETLPSLCCLYNLRPASASAVAVVVAVICRHLPVAVCCLSSFRRDLQRLSGNATSKVGHMSSKEIRELGATRHSVEKLNDESIPTIQDALLLTSNSVQQIVLDVKVGPPFFEKGLAEDVLSIVEKTECRNCVIWAKSDDLAREVIKISSEITVGYIVMREPKTGARTNLLRMKGAEVVGVYHPLIDEKLMKILHRRNKKVYAWTVDDEESMQKMLFEHVDAIVTGNPTLLQLLMQDTRTQCLEEGYSLSN